MLTLKINFCNQEIYMNARTYFGLKSRPSCQTLILCPRNTEKSTCQIFFFQLSYIWSIQLCTFVVLQSPNQKPGKTEFSDNIMLGRTRLNRNIFRIRIKTEVTDLYTERIIRCGQFGQVSDNFINDQDIYLEVLINCTF